MSDDESQDDNSAGVSEIDEGANVGGVVSAGDGSAVDSITQVGDYDPEITSNRVFISEKDQHLHFSNTARNSRVDPISEEDFPYSRHCSPVWTDVTKTKQEYFSDTDQTIVQGKVRNRIGHPHTAQVSVQFTSPVDDQGVTRGKSTLVALRPNEKISWEIAIDGQVEDLKIDDPWVRKCKSAVPPWTGVPLDLTAYPECTWYTTHMHVVDTTSVRDRTHVTVRVDNMFGVDITAEFYLEYTVNDRSEQVGPFTETIPGSSTVDLQKVINVQRSDLEDDILAKPRQSDKDCRLIYGEI